MLHRVRMSVDSFLYIDIGNEDPLTVRQRGTTSLVAGQTISVGPTAENVHLFDRSGKPIHRSTNPGR